MVRVYLCHCPGIKTLPVLIQGYTIAQRRHGADGEYRNQSWPPLEPIAKTSPGFPLSTIIREDEIDGGS